MLTQEILKKRSKDGFVRKDKSNNELSICTDKFNDDIKISHWVLLKNLYPKPKHVLGNQTLKHELIRFKYSDYSGNSYQMLYSLMPDHENSIVILDKKMVKTLVKENYSVMAQQEIDISRQFHLPWGCLLNSLPIKKLFF